MPPCFPAVAPPACALRFCVLVPVRFYAWVRAYVCLCVNTRACLGACVRPCARARAHVCAYTRVHMRAYEWVCVRACARVRVRTCARAHVRTCVQANPNSMWAPYLALLPEQVAKPFYSFIVLFFFVQM